MEADSFHPGISTPESLQGPYVTNVTDTVLPSVLPAALLQAPGGLHRFEPVYMNGIAPIRGNFLPDKEFRYLRTVYAVTSCICKRPGRFRLALHVAMEFGPYHPTIDGFYEDGPASGLWGFLSLLRISSSL